MHTIQTRNRSRVVSGLCEYIQEYWLICCIIIGSVWEPLCPGFKPKKNRGYKKEGGARGKRRSNKNSLQQHTSAGLLFLDFRGWNILFFQTMRNETGLELNSISDSDNATSVLFDVFRPTSHQQDIVVLFAPPSLLDAAQERLL